MQARTCKKHIGGPQKKTGFSQKVFCLTLRNHCSGVGDIKLWILYRSPGKTEAIECIRWPKRLFFVLLLLSLFKSHRMQAEHHFQPKMGSKMVGVRTKKIGLIRRIFNPHSPKKKINSHVTSRSVVRDLRYRIFRLQSHAGLDLQKNTSGARQKTGFSQKVFFWHCETIVVVSVTSNLNPVPKSW